MRFVVALLAVAVVASAAVLARAGDGCGVEERLSALEQRVGAIETKVGIVPAGEAPPRLADVVPADGYELPAGASKAASVLLAQWRGTAADATNAWWKFASIEDTYKGVPAQSKAALEGERTKALAAYRRAWTDARDAKADYEKALAGK